MSCGVGFRRGSDSALLWLWCRPVATAPIGPLAWESPFAMEAAQEIAKRQKKKTKQKNSRLEQTLWPIITSWFICFASRDVFKGEGKKNPGRFGSV